jgi:hypothetical protein
MGLSCQRVELLCWIQLSCRSQLTFADHVHDLNAPAAMVIAADQNALNPNIALALRLIAR